MKNYSSQAFKRWRSYKVSETWKTHSNIYCIYILFPSKTCLSRTCTFLALAIGKKTKNAQGLVEDREALREEEDNLKLDIDAVKEEIKKEKDETKIKKLEKVRRD